MTANTPILQISNANRNFQMIKLLSLGILILLSPFVAEAHPGNTAADGCHYCRTNCDKWGEVWNARHCHGGGSAVIYELPSNTPIPLPTWTQAPTWTPRPTNTLIPTRTPTPSITLTPTITLNPP